MDRTIYLYKIENRIKAIGKGNVFIASDFHDLADAQTIRKALSRLEKSGLIRRVLRGVYDYPEYSMFMGEFLAPDYYKVAHALARNYSWTIVPCGDTALNLLGLSTQVPSVWSYVSSGKYIEYEIDKIKIEFRHTANKEISFVSPKTALIIQAIKALSKDNIDGDIIKRISATLSPEEKRSILNEAKYTTVWVYVVIREIAGAEESG